MSDQVKKSFILSVKRLRYFFNHMKEFDLEQGPLVDQRANVQSCSDDDMSNIIKWMEEGTQAIAESRKFIELIQSQENEKFVRLIKDKQKVIDAQSSAIQQLESQIKAIQEQIEEKQNREKSIRREIAEDNKQTEQELKRIDDEIAEINKQKELFVKKEEAIIDQIEAEEDRVRDQYHCVKNQLDRAEENSQLMYFFPQRVAYMTENIERKRDELQLYQSIINESLNFLKSKIHENVEKQVLVRQMNEQVAILLKETLRKEQEFYESDAFDKLKVAPHVLVKRLDR